MQSGYFDFNATTPLIPQVRELYLETLDQHWHNPSALYHDGGRAKRLLEQTREALATQLGMDEPARIVFTSGATESNHLAFRHTAGVCASDAVVLISPVEHPCVRAAAAENFPGRVIEMPLEPGGTADVSGVRKLIRDKRPSLVSVMAANNETGVLHPWKELRDCAREAGIPFHCDASQWLGKMPAGELGSCDWLSGSGHKFGAPKGIGLLVAPGGLDQLRGSFGGGRQENGLRAGTENLPGAAALEAALRMVGSWDNGRDKFEERLAVLVRGVRLLGKDSPRLPNTSMCVLPEFSNLKWLTQLSHLGFQVSTGSACSSGKGNPSHVMAAMGLDYDEMGRTLRVSSGWTTTERDWSQLAAAFDQVWQQLRDPSKDTRRSRNISLEWSRQPEP